MVGEAVEIAFQVLIIIIIIIIILRTPFHLLHSSFLILNCTRLTARYLLFKK